MKYYRFILSDYLKSHRYFVVYDALLKKAPVTKDDRLNELGISPASYRRSRAEERKIGEEISKKLDNEFNLIRIDKKELCEIEILLSSIYQDIYYRNDENIELYKEQLNQKIACNYSLFPILKLFMLFINLTTYKTPIASLNENKPMYEEIKQYISFYNKALLEVYDIVCFLYEEEIGNIEKTLDFAKGLKLFLLSTRSYTEKKYEKSLLYASECKAILINDFNIKRLVALNLSIYASLNNTGRFLECYNRTENQLRMLESMKMYDQIYNGTLSHHVLASLAIGRYEEVINHYSKKTYLNSTETILMLIAYSYEDSNQFEMIYKKYQKENDSEIEMIKCVHAVYEILKGIDVKKNFLLIEKTELRESIKIIIKRLEKIK